MASVVTIEGNFAEATCEPPLPGGSQCQSKNPAAAYSPRPFQAKYHRRRGA